MHYMGFIFFTVFANAGAQLMLKHGMTSLAPISFAGTNPLMKVLEITFNPWVFAGLFAYVISMASHMYVLSKVEVSFVYPFLSLTTVVIAVIAYLVFRENLDAYRIAGIALICLGTVLVFQSGPGAAAPAPGPLHVQGPSR